MDNSFTILCAVEPNTLKSMSHVHRRLSKLYSEIVWEDFRATSMIFLAVNWLNKLRDKIIFYS